MMMKTMLKMAAVAMLAVGVVLWRLHDNRNIRLSRDDDQDSDLNDLGNEMATPNRETDDVIRPSQQLFPFPELCEAGLRCNVILAKIDSWKSNSSEWRGFKRLRIAGSLASGSYGEVMVAFDDDEREVAVKSVSKEALSFRGPGFIAREVAIMESLKQENVIPMLAWFENDTAVNIVMQHAKYGSVKALLRRNDDWLEEELVAKIVACTARGLAYMHESDVIHRDVKPDNLLIAQWTPVLQVKICDFGEAERNGTDDHKGYIGGTEGYCSPEYIDGSGYGPCIDMWSLGVTLYELLFGCLPFDQGNARDAEINMDNRDLSNDAVHLILQLLNKNHMERIKARGVLNHPWIKAHACKDE